MNLERSGKLFEEARRVLPGGVDSPVRAFKAVGGNPPFIAHGEGARLHDEDGNSYLDYVCSWGPMILGHADPAVVAAVTAAVTRGTSFGAPTELETTLAKMVTRAIRSIEMIRFVSSGTEATMSALRLARAFTGRDRIIKFAGGYHGHSDGLLAKAGSGLATLGIRDSPGVPEAYAATTLVVPYNDLAAVEEAFTRHRGEIAAVIIEPIAANMGVVPPAPGFLEGLRDLTRKHGALLIFDEVISGFRVAYGGAQELFGVVPDLTCLGKIIGGGLPVGAYGGRREIMEMMAPLGPVYQAGTLSGNPLAMTAGIETIRRLGEPGVYDQLEKKSATLENGIIAAAAGAGVPMCVSRVSSLMTAFFTGDPVTDFETASRCDTTAFARFHGRLLAGGVYWPPSQFEAAFVSLAHGNDDIRFTISAIERALAAD